jgi:S-DNA-T family DNA segregation ATPase FtsK/SpoIIIE
MILMTALMGALDKRRHGTHYADRMQRILSVCQDCGLLWHDERITYRTGVSEVKRVTDIRGANRVLVTPQYEKYGLQVNPRVLKRVQGLAKQFAYALNVPSAAVEVDGNIVYVRVPLAVCAEDRLVTFEQAWQIEPRLPGGCLLLGVDEEHNQLVLDLTAPTNVHAAVIGMTGSGKSTLLKTMILSAELVGEAQVALFDPSRGLYPLSGHPSVWRGGLFSQADECEAGLAALARTVSRGAGRLTYVFVDEVPDLVAQRPRVRDHLARLAQAGRHAGIHLVMGAQHLLSSEMGPMTMRNVPVRLVGRVADSTAGYQAAGRGDVGAESLRGRGDFVVVTGSQVRHFQAAYVSEPLLRAWERRYPPRTPAVPVEGTAGVARAASYANQAPAKVLGRPQDDIPPEVLALITAYVDEHRRAPSCNWVYQHTRDLLPGGGYSRAKARRAIALATVDQGAGVMVQGESDGQANR